MSAAVQVHGSVRARSSPRCGADRRRANGLFENRGGRLPRSTRGQVGRETGPPWGECPLPPPQIGSKRTGRPPMGM